MCSYLFKALGLILSIVCAVVLFETSCKIYEDKYLPPAIIVLSIIINAIVLGGSMVLKPIYMIFLHLGDILLNSISIAILFPWPSSGTFPKDCDASTVTTVASLQILGIIFCAINIVFECCALCDDGESQESQSLLRRPRRRWRRRNRH